MVAERIVTAFGAAVPLRDRLVSSMNRGWCASEDPFVVASVGSDMAMAYLIACDQRETSAKFILTPYLSGHTASQTVIIVICYSRDAARRRRRRPKMKRM